MFAASFGSYSGVSAEENRKEAVDGTWRTPEMTDQDVLDHVRRQLRDQGVDAEVSFDPDGRLQIEREE